MAAGRRIWFGLLAGLFTTSTWAWQAGAWPTLDRGDARNHSNSTDHDRDGIVDGQDNCPFISNPDQSDADDDGIGDVCDGCPADPQNDVDEDSICGDVDNCPSVANFFQSDADGDGQGNLCDPCPQDSANDLDGDGICGDLDNCPAAFNPGQVDGNANGRGDACDTATKIMIVDQDIRSDSPTLAQHFQQCSARLGVRNTGKFRTLAWADVSTIPVDATVVSATLVFHTTSGDPAVIDNNGDDPPQGGPITVEVHQMLRPWNYDEPLTYPASLTDNDKTVAAGETSWRDSIYPTRWSIAGASSATDAGPSVSSTVVTSTLDTRFDFTSSGLAGVVQHWISGTDPNHGFMLRASDADEASAVSNRKVFCGKGFPLETSTNLSQAVAESHRPYLLLEYDNPHASPVP